MSIIDMAKDSDAKPEWINEVTAFRILDKAHEEIEQATKDIWRSKFANKCFIQTCNLKKGLLFFHKSAKHRKDMYF